MYAGRIVEEGSVDDVLDRPLHPYTRGLIQSVPSRTVRGKRLHTISGMTPSLLNLPSGCSFMQRCTRAEIFSAKDTRRFKARAQVRAARGMRLRLVRGSRGSAREVWRGHFDRCHQPNTRHFG